jgi:beta-mannosidase
MDEAWINWGWARSYDTPDDSAAVRDAYDRIFHGLLPEVLAQEDPDRPYWPSSPSLGWGDPESLRQGDAHYWGVWHGQEPFEVFEDRVPRFMSEFGFQALPPMETVEAFTEEGDRSLFNPMFLVHQKHPIGNELITEYMERDYPVPSAFADFLYVSQLLQARGMRTAFEAHRRAMPRTMGTLYWQLNDTWPVVSWSSRDYFGRWKALHYAAREAYEPLLLSPVLAGDSVFVFWVTDLLESLRGTMKLEMLDFSGEVRWQEDVSVHAGPNQSKVVWRGTLDDLLEGVDPQRSVLAARLALEPDTVPPSPGVDDPGADEAGIALEALLFFARPKDLALGTPTIRIAVDGPEEGQAPRGPWVTLTLEADVLARDVSLSLGSVTPHHFEDNFFHLLPGRPREVRLYTALSPEEVESGLRVRTLAEVPRDGVPADSSLTAADLFRPAPDSVGALDSFGALPDTAGTAMDTLGAPS